MGAFRGAAALTWVDADDINTERVLLLREPLRELRPAHQQAVYTADSLDFTQRQVFTVGTGADELVGRVRYQDDQQGLADLLKAGTKGRTLTYLPNLADPARSFACYLISPLSPFVLGMDPDRGTSFGDLDVELRLRLTAGTSFGPDVWAQGLLFDYVAGGSLRAGTFSRTGNATYRDKLGVGKTAATGIPRISWRANQPHLLLEAARTQLVTDPENFGVWTVGGTPILTSGQADPFGGTAAYLINDDSAAVTESIYEPVTFTADAEKCISVFVKQGTSDDFMLGLYDNTAGAWRHEVTGTWSAGVPSLATFVGAGTRFPVEPYANGWWRVAVSATGVIAANVNRFFLAPTRDTVGDTGTTFFYGANAWNAVFPTSYQGPTLGTKNADSLTFVYNELPQAQAWYLKFVELGSYATAGTGYVGIGDASTSGSLYFSFGGGGAYAFTHRTAADVFSAATLNPTEGDLVELLGLLYTDGSVQLLAAKNSGTVVTGTQSAANTMLPTWASTVLRMNARSTGTIGFSGTQLFRIHRGTTINTLSAARNF
jgi:hypothetical protein